MDTIVVMVSNTEGLVAEQLALPDGNVLLRDLFILEKGEHKPLVEPQDVVQALQVVWVKVEMGWELMAEAEAVDIMAEVAEVMAEVAEEAIMPEVRQV